MNDSTLINGLEAITKQLASIKHDTMITDSKDTIKTVALVLTPFLFGLILFLLNRKKEHKFKKADLCGEIYACLEELKMATGGWVTAQIHFLGFSRANVLVNETIFTNVERNEIEKAYQNSGEELRIEIEKMNIVVKNLRKHVGIYRFYLPKEKKQELDKLMEPFLTRWSLEYDFSDLNNMEEVKLQMEEINSTYNKEQTPIDQLRYKAIINFIDDFETEYLI